MMGMGDYPGYTSSKSAITGLTRSMAREFGPDNIRCNAVMPGWVLTERQRELWAPPGAIDAFIAKQCLKREILPVDMVDPVLFLASGNGSIRTIFSAPMKTRSETIGTAFAIHDISRDDVE